MKREVPIWQKPKFTIEVVLSVAGLVLGLVTFQPQLEVSAGEPSRGSEPFSVPFRLTNTGLVAVQDVRITCYAHHVEVGGLSIDDSGTGDPGWTARTLEHQESQTIVCRLIESNAPSMADIAIVVDYRWPWLPVHSRRCFRFVGEPGSNWQWFQQPAEQILADVDAFMRRVEEWRRRLPAAG